MKENGMHHTTAKPFTNGSSTGGEKSQGHILIVEDEAHLAQGLLFNLHAEGYEAAVAGDGETALAWMREGFGESPRPFDAVVLDVMLPGIDGFGVARALRAAEDYTPVLMLTARGRPEDVLEGFAAGADDYLPKPFELSILLARLKGLLRRTEWLRSQPTHEPGTPSQDIVVFSGKTVDFAGLELRTANKQVRLTLMEAELLRHLIQNPGRAISRREILEQVWHMREDTDTRAIDNFVVRLRRYLEDDPSRPVHLQTVRGVGYRFVLDAEDDVE